MINESFGLSCIWTPVHHVGVSMCYYSVSSPIVLKSRRLWDAPLCCYGFLSVAVRPHVVPIILLMTVLSGITAAARRGEHYHRD